MFSRLKNFAESIIYRSDRLEEQSDTSDQVDPSIIGITTEEESDADSEPSIRIDHDALSGILLREGVRDKPIAVISIVGLMRTGKSFLLNFIIRYLEQRGWENDNWLGGGNVGVGTNGTVWGGGRERVTRGIQLLNRIFTIPSKNGEQVNVLLVDTQGLFDHETPENVNKVLLTLSTLMSSVQMFNSKEQIDSNQLDYLKVCIDFAEETARLQGPNNFLKLQRLLFLVRDHVAHDEDEDGGKAYLDKVLDGTKGGRQLLDVRKRIKTSFEDVSCFFIGYPGKRAQARSFTGTNKEIDEDFLKSVKAFVENLMNPENLNPKSSHEKPLTGKELLNILASMDEIFAQNKFDPDQVKKDEMVNTWTAEGFENICNELENAAQKEFTEIPFEGIGEQKDRYSRHLLAQCKEYREIMRQRAKNQENARKLEMKENLQKAFERYEAKISDFVASLDKSKEEIDSFCSKTRIKILQKFDGKIDQDAFNKLVGDRIEKFTSEYEKKQKEKKDAEQDERRNRVYKIFEELQKEINITWKGSKASGNASRREMEKVIKANHQAREEKEKARVKMTAEIKKEMLEHSLKEFYKFCSGHYIAYGEKIDQVLQEAKHDAKKKNEENWIRWKDALTQKIETLLSDGERKIADKMKGAYLGEEVVKQYYEGARGSLKKTFDEATNRKPTKMQNKYLREQQKRLDDRYEKIKFKNEKNKDIQPVKNTKPKPMPKSDIWCAIL